jgi:subtilisin family serine protease
MHDHLNSRCSIFAKTLTLLVFFLLMASSWAATLTQKDAAKTTPEVIEQAKKGVPQQLFVILEHKAILEKEKEKQRARKLKFNDKQLTEETKREFDELKKSVFANGRLGEAQVVYDDRNVPILEVNVPDLKALEQLLSHPKVLRVNPNQLYKPALSKSLPLINQPTAINNGKTGAGTKIAILDTGVNIRHEDFSTTRSFPACRLSSMSSTIWGGELIGTGKCRIANALIFGGDDFEWYSSDSNHGSNVAAIAAQVAPGATISALQVFYTTPNGLYSDTRVIRNAMQWVLDNVTSGAQRIVAMNLSLDNVPGTVYSRECGGHTFEPYFERARTLGVLPVVATGNSAKSTGVSDPACVPGAVRVGAVYSGNFGAAQFGFESTYCRDSSTSADQIACFSNSNPLVTLLAPGALISAGGAVEGGTSMAAPHIAGAVAVLRAQNAFPDDSPGATVSRMVNNGKPITDPRNNVTKPRLNLYAALTQATPPYVPPPSAPNQASFLLPVFQMLLLGD